MVNKMGVKACDCCRTTDMIMAEGANGIREKGIMMKKIIISLLFVAFSCVGHSAWATVGGDLIWETVDAQGGKQDAAASVVDPNGNTFVTGYSQAVGGNEDFYTAKVDSAGVVQWSKYLDMGRDANEPDLSSENDRAVALAFDSNGNIVVAGYGSVGGNINIMVTKYDAATGNELWTEPLVYDSAVGGPDYPTALIVDSDDNIYVAGYSQSASGTDDGLILKLAADGSLIRAVSFDAGASADDRITSIAAGNDTPGIADDDFVVVSGYTWVDHSGRNDFDLMTIKFNAGGVEQWRSVYDGGSGGDSGLFIAIDSAYNVVVSGYVTTGSRKDIITIKYGAYGDGNGGADTLWQKLYSGGEQNISHGLWLDQASGDVFITGATFNNTGMDDFYTAGYASSDGALLWEQIYASSGVDQKDIPAAITGDGAGGLYVTGYTEDGATGNKDLLTLKYYQNNGHLLWHDLHDGPAGGIQESVQVAVALNVSTAGNVFVAGWSGTQTDFGTGTATVVAPDNYTVTDSNQIPWSTAQWHYYYVLMTSGLNQGESRRILANTADTLTIESALPNPVQMGDTFTINNPFDYDYYVVDYDRGLVNPPTGLSAVVASENEIDLSWQDNSPAISEDDFCIERCIGIDCQNFAEINCIPGDTVTSPAQTYQDTGLNPQTRYSYRVRTKNRTSLDYSGYSDPVGGFTNVFNPTSPAWQYIYNSPDDSNDEARAIAVGPDNDPVVTGSSNSLTGQFDYYTVKINHNDPLDEKWSHRYDDPDNQTDIATCVAVDDNNGAFVSGYSSLYDGGTANTNDIFSLKFPAAGPDPYNLDFAHNYGATWMAQYGGPGGGDDRAEAVESVSDGSADVVVGYGKNAAGNDDIYVVKYLADGTQAWAADPPFDGGAGDYPRDVSFDPAGDVLVAGTTNNGVDDDIFLQKYSGVDGSVLWTLIFDSGYGNDGLNSVITDAVGNVYVAGYVSNAAGNLDMYFSKYDKDGNTDDTANELWTNIIGGDGLAYDEAMSLSYDADVNEILIAGMVTSATGSIDYHVRRYDIAGNMIWKRTLDRSVADDFLVGMVIDRDGDICLGGNTDNGANTDVLSVCYDSLGNITGSNLFNGTADSDDMAVAMTVNPLGEMFVAGYTVNVAGDRDYLVFKIESNTLQAPDNFTAMPRYTTADLTWDDNSPDEDSFYIWRKDGACAAGGSYNNIYVSGPGETSFADTGLTQGGVYCYRIQAMKGGISSLPVEVEANTSLAPLPGCNAVLTNTTQIDLSWTDATSGAEGIDVSRCTGLDCTSFSNMAALAPGIESYSDASTCELAVNANEPYSYRIRIYNNTENWEAVSDCVNVNPKAAQAVSSFAANTVSEGEVELRWTDTNSDSTAYKVYKCEDTGSGCTPAYLTTISHVNISSGELLELQMEESNWTGSAGEIIDTSGNGTNGTAIYGATSTSNGYTGRGGSFDGVDDQVQWTYPGGLPANNFTMMAWVKAIDTHQVDGQSTTSTTGTSGQNWIFGPDMPASTNDSGAGVSVGTNGISVYEHSGGYMPPLAVYSATIGTGWNHIAVTYSNGLPRIYLNGILVRTGLQSPKTNVYATQKAGGGPYGNFHGSIDEVRIFNRALSDSEVATMAAAAGVSVSYDSYIDTGVLPDHTYNYQVTAIKTAACSWEGPAASDSAISALLTPCPLNAVASNTNTVNLAWTDNFGTEDGYHIDRCEGAGCLSSCDADTANCRVGATTTDNVNFSDSTVVPGTTYTYQAEAFKGAVGAWDWLSSCIKDVTAPLPVVPDTLVTSRYSEQEIKLVWNDNNNDETGFDVERCEVGVDCPTYSLVGLAAVATGQGSYIDKGPSGNGLIPDHLYRYRVRAVKAGAPGWPTAYSNESEASPTIIAPDSLTAKSINASRVDLTWVNHTTWESGFSIGRCEVGVDCPVFSEIATIGPGTSKYYDMAACENTTYQYQITTVNSAWPTNPVTAVPAEAATPAVVAPYNLTVSPSSESEVDISWQDSNAAKDGFTVERCDDTLANCTAGTSTYTPVASFTSTYPIAPPTDYSLHYKMDRTSWLRNVPDQVLDSAGTNNALAQWLGTSNPYSDITGRSAYFYSASSGYIMSKNPIVLSRNHSTLNWWMKSATTNDSGLFSRSSSGGLLSIIESKTSSLYGETDSNCNYFTFNGVTKNFDWTMYSIVFDNAHAFLYVNGEYFGETADYGTNNCDQAAPVNELVADTTLQYIGAPTGYSTSHYIGVMDEVGVFDRALNAEEIRALHDSMATKFTLNLEDGSWNGTTGEVTDSSFAGHPGTAYGNTTPASMGEHHGAAYFDGDDDYITLGDIDELDLPYAMSVSLWFNRTADQASASSHGINNVLISQSSATSIDNLEIGSQGTALEVYLDTYSGSNTVMSIEANIQNDTWYHLVLTYGANDAFPVKLYLDGKLVGQWSDRYNHLNSSTTSPITLGLAQESTLIGDFKGYIDDVSVSIQALTAAQVDNLYHGSYTDSGLQPITTYTYRVTTDKNTGCQFHPASAPVEVTMPTPPGATNVTAVPVDTTTINLTWTNKAGSATAVRVLRCEGVGCSNYVQVGVDLPASAESYTDTGICVPDIYRYRVAAVVGGVEIMDQDGPAETSPLLPIAPVNLMADSPSETETHLSWDDNMSDETGYKIERCVGAACVSTQADIIGEMDYDFVDDFEDGIQPANWSQQGYLETISSSTVPMNILDTSGSVVTTAVNGTVDMLTTSTGIGADATFNQARLTAAASTLTALGSGDFDVRVDYSMPDGNISTSLTQYFIPVRLQVNLGADFFYVERSLNAGVNRYTGFSKINSIASSNSLSTNETAGKLRLTRVGNTISCYAWTGGSWALIHSAQLVVSGVVPNWVVLNQYAERNEAASMHAVIDNFTYMSDAVNSYNFSERGLTPPGTTYNYKVYPFKGSCLWDQNYSSQVEITNSIIPPTNLAADMVNTTEVDLKWTDTTTSETGFEIERCDGTCIATDSFVNISQNSAGVNTYTDATPIPGTTYSYRVRAVNNTLGWVSDYSNILTVVTEAVTAPANLVNNPGSEIRIELAWDRNSTDEDSVVIQRGDAACTNFSSLPALPAGVTSYTDTSISESTTYCYQVQVCKNDIDPGAADNSWCSAFSNQVLATSTIASPDPLSGPFINTTQAKIRWADNTESETGFVVERCEGSGCSNFTEVSGSPVGPDTTVLMDTSLCNGTTYNYRVKAVNSTLWSSPYSATVEVVTPKPVAVTDLAAAEIVGSLDTRQINVSWTDKNIDEDGFSIERCEGAGCSDFQALDTVASQENVTLGLDPAFWAQSAWLETTSSNTPPVNISDASGDATILEYNAGVDLKVSSTGGGTSYNAAKVYMANPAGLGDNDFDIQIDYTLPDGALNNVTADQIYMRLRISFPDPDGAGPLQYDYIYVQHIATAAGDKYQMTMRVNNVTSVDEVFTTDTNSTLRITRIGNVLQGSVWTNGAWASGPPSSPIPVDAVPDSLNWGPNANRADAVSMHTFVSDFRSTSVYSDTSVLPSSDYCYRVAPTKSYGCSWDPAADNLYSVVCSKTAPAAPSNLISTVDGMSISLDWDDNSSDEDGFQIEKKLVNGRFIVLDTVGSGVTTYTNSTWVEPNSTYTYRVRAIRGADKSAYSNEITGTTLDWQAPICVP